MSNFLGKTLARFWQKSVGERHRSPSFTRLFTIVQRVVHRVVHRDPHKRFLWPAVGPALIVNHIEKVAPQRPSCEFLSNPS